MATFVAGTDIIVVIDVKDSTGAVKDLSMATLVLVLIANSSHSEKLLGPYTADPNFSQDTFIADFSEGHVIIKIPKAEAATLPGTNVLVDVQATIAGDIVPFLSTEKVQVQNWLFP